MEAGTASVPREVAHEVNQFSFPSFFHLRFARIQAKVNLPELQLIRTSKRTSVCELLKNISRRRHTHVRADSQWDKIEAAEKVAIRLRASAVSRLSGRRSSPSTSGGVAPTSGRRRCRRKCVAGARANALTSAPHTKTSW